MSYRPGACVFCDLHATSTTDPRSVNTVTPCVVQWYFVGTGYYDVKVVERGEWRHRHIHRKGVSSNTFAGNS